MCARTDNDGPAGYVSSPYSTVGRSWAMLCAPPGSEDSADETDVIFAALCLLCGNTLAHLAETVPESAWYQLLRTSGPPALSAASDAVAHMAWWIYITSGGSQGLADTLIAVSDPLRRRRMLEAVELWLQDTTTELPKAARALELVLLSIIAEEFQLRAVADAEGARNEWVNALVNLTEITDVIVTSDVRRGYLKRLYASPTGVLS